MAAARNLVGIACKFSRRWLSAAGYSITAQRLLGSDPGRSRCAPPGAPALYSVWNRCGSASEDNAARRHMQEYVNGRDLVRMRGCSGGFVGLGTFARSRQTQRRIAYVAEAVAPQVGLEPTTLRLTAECSAIELLRNKKTRCRRAGAGSTRKSSYIKRDGCGQNQMAAIAGEGKSCAAFSRCSRARSVIRAIQQATTGMSSPKIRVSRNRP